MIALSLVPLDTWQFGLGIPSQAESASQLTRASAIPPSPTTVAGALRAALARARGWNGSSSWEGNPELVKLLGNGPDDYGETTFVGPLLAEGGVLLVPVPATGRLLQDKVVVTVVPGEPVLCDLDAEVRLPEGFEKGEEVAEENLVRADDAAALLAGWEVDKERLIARSDLFSLEPRTGIARDRATRTAAEGALFDVVHVRPRSGRDPALVMLASGNEDYWRVVEGAVPLGAEGRLGVLSRWNHPIPSFAASEEDLERIQSDGCAALLVVTPLLLSANEWQGKAPLSGLDAAHVVSACGPRPMRLGGWDGRRRSPTPQRSFVAPGTVLYVQHEEGKALVEALHELGSMPQIGSRVAAGFGLVMVRPWPMIPRPKL